MKRSIKTAFAIALVALAVPAAALATRHDGRSPGNHQHQFQTGQAGASGTTVSAFDPSTGTLTLALASGGSVTGTVGDGTRIVCLGDWRHFFFHGRGRFGHDRRFTTLKRDGYRHGDWGSTGPTGDTGSTGSTGPTGSTGDQGSGNGYPHHGYPHGYPQGGGGQGDSHHHFHHQDNGGPQHESCDSSLLIQGVSILNASLEITSRGAEFGEIVLLPAVQ